jgi:hypothetical protein
MRLDACSTEPGQHGAAHQAALRARRIAADFAHGRVVNGRAVASSPRTGEIFEQQLAEASALST